MTAVREIDGLSVHVFTDLVLDETVVAATQTVGGTRYALQLEDTNGHITVSTLGPGEQRRMILRLPSHHQFFTLLTKALIDAGYGPMDEQAGAIATHLRDAMTVRDRLTAVIEHLIGKKE